MAEEVKEDTRQEDIKVTREVGPRAARAAGPRAEKVTKDTEEEAKEDTEEQKVTNTKEEVKEDTREEVKGGYQGWYQAGGNQVTKGGGKGGFVPHSERDCYKCGGKGHIAQNCPGSATEVNPGPGGAAGVTPGEQPQGLGQPLPGMYSVELGDAKDDVPSNLGAQELVPEVRRAKLSGVRDC